MKVTRIFNFADDFELVLGNELTRFLRLGISEDIEVATIAFHEAKIPRFSCFCRHGGCSSLQVALSRKLTICRKPSEENDARRYQRRASILLDFML